MGVCKTIKRKNSMDYDFLEVFEIFKQEKISYGREKVTVQSYYESVQKFIKSIQGNNITLQDIDNNDVLEFIYCMKGEGLRVSTINHYLRDLRAFFNWCYKAGYIKKKIEVKLVKCQETVKETYTEDELKKLLEPPKGNGFREWRSWAIINWILATGNRERTVCNIKIKDLDFQEREIILRQTKNKKIQIIPMSSELLYVMRGYIRDFRSEAAPDDYLFCNIAGEQLTENGLKIAIRVYNHSRGVERTSIHAFRHTFAKHWIRNNGDVFRLQKMLGHSSLDMTRVYVNMFSADLKDGFDTYSPLDRIVKKSGMKQTVKRKVIY